MGRRAVGTHLWEAQVLRSRSSTGCELEKLGVLEGSRHGWLRRSAEREGLGDSSGEHNLTAVPRQSPSAKRIIHWARGRLHWRIACCVATKSRPHLSCFTRVWWEIGIFIASPINRLYCLYMLSCFSHKMHGAAE